MSDIVRNPPSKEEVPPSPAEASEPEPDPRSGSGTQPKPEVRPVRGRIVAMPPDLRAIYRRARSFVKDMTAYAKDQTKVASLAEGMQIAMDMVHGFAHHEVLHYRELAMPAPPTDLVAHSVKVSILALHVGAGMGYPAIKLEELVLAGLLNNIGMAMVPEDIWMKKGMFTVEEKREVEKHSEYGYRFLMDTYGERFGHLALIVYQIHEREGGQGYPLGLEGDEIHDFAKIVGLVDIYLALTAERPQRKQYHQFEAIKQIISLKKGYFPAAMIKMLLRQLSVFPVLSLVRLNFGAIGKVIETSRELPLRPTVEIIYDANGQMVMKKKIIKLSESPLVYITDLVHEEEIRPS